MNSEIWGPYFWFTLHTVTLAYPEKPTYVEKSHYQNFFLSLQNVLPCKVCQQHYNNHLKEFPIGSFLEDKESLVIWCFKLHNKVNESLGKKLFTFKEFKDKYRKIYAPTILQKVTNTECIKKYKKYKFIILIILLVSVLIIIYKFYRKRAGLKFFRK
tara:strand:+ start:966 stop:1436 length:471 start_codon:yes stop_codon:yes gene_type:complete